jgi:hypothetical protein
VHQHESAHVAARKKALGSSAVKRPSFDFGPTVMSQSPFTATAITLEDTGVQAYQGQAPFIKSRPPEPAGVEPPVSCVVGLEEEVVSAQHLSKRAGSGFRSNRGHHDSQAFASRRPEHDEIPGTERFWRLRRSVRLFAVCELLRPVQEMVGGSSSLSREPGWV